jgi:hypothetical protein
MMLVLWVALALAGAQDEKPLAGYLPPADRPVPLDRGKDDRPHGKLFISPMGEPFRGNDPVRAWFDGADANHDGALTKAEFIADAMRFFAQLDRGKDGEIDPDDIEFYETALAPEIRTGGEAGAAGMRGSGGRGRRGGGRGGRRRGGPPPGDVGTSGGDDGGRGEAIANQRYAATRRGAARYSFFDYPEPITVADTNFNRGVDAEEFRTAAAERFALLDKSGRGKLTFTELPRLDLPEASLLPRRVDGQWRQRRQSETPGAERATPTDE